LRNPHSRGGKRKKKKKKVARSVPVRREGGEKRKKKGIFLPEKARPVLFGGPEERGANPLGGPAHSLEKKKKETTFYIKSLLNLPRRRGNRRPPGWQEGEKRGRSSFTFEGAQRTSNQGKIGRTSLLGKRKRAAWYSPGYKEGDPPLLKKRSLLPVERKKKWGGRVKSSKGKKEGSYLPVPQRKTVLL